MFKNKGKLGTVQNQMKNYRDYTRILTLILIFGSLAWNLLIWFFPVAVHILPVKLSILWFSLFAPICHHLPESTFQYHSVFLPVCIRCSSIYFSFFVGVSIYYLLNHFKIIVPEISFQTLIIGIVFMTIDVLLNGLGLKPPFWSVKIITGIFFGLTSGWFLMQSLYYQSLKRFSEYV